MTSRILVSLFRDGESTATSNVDKANALNRQFNSVFSSRSVLDIVKLCLGVLLDGISSGLDLLVLDHFKSKVPTMPDIELYHSSGAFVFQAAHSG